MSMLPAAWRAGLAIVEACVPNSLPPVIVQVTLLLRRHCLRKQVSLPRPRHPAAQPSWGAMLARAYNIWKSRRSRCMRPDGNSGRLRFAFNALGESLHLARSDHEDRSSPNGNIDVFSQTADRQPSAQIAISASPAPPANRPRYLRHPLRDDGCVMARRRLRKAPWTSNRRQ